MSLLPVGAAGQDFERTYEPANGGRITIANVSGNISVAGYNGSSILVRAYKEGPDRDAVEIEDQSTPDHVSLRAKYPRWGNTNASVKFVVQVPREIRYRFDSLSTASGDIEIFDVAGEIFAKSASGDLSLRGVEGTIDASTASGDVTVEEAVGEVKARSASGDVEVEIIETLGEGDLSFSTASGDVTVRAPAHLDAEVRMSTASGSLKTDFPLTLDDLDGPGKKAFGTLGRGGRQLKISTASGSVRLLQVSR